MNKYLKTTAIGILFIVFACREGTQQPSDSLDSRLFGFWTGISKMSAYLFESDGKFAYAISKYTIVQPDGTIKVFYNLSSKGQWKCNNNFVILTMPGTNLGQTVGYSFADTNLVLKFNDTLSVTYKRDSLPF